MDKFQDIYNLNVHSSCRTCLTNLNDMHHNIFTTPDLQTKFAVCTSLPVELGDEFPTCLCEPCYTKINDFYDFKQMCLSALERFKNYIKSEESSCPLKFHDDSDIQTNFIMLESNKEVDQISCLEVVDDKMLNVNKNEASPLEEEEVGISEDDHNTLNNDVKEVKEIKRFPCQQCDKSYTRHNRLERHIKTKHERDFEGKYNCQEPECDITMCSRKALQQHIKDVHGNKTRPSFICETCGKVLKSSITLKNHFFLHTGQQLPFECQLCQKRYVTKGHLTEHMNRHAGIKKYTCPHCGDKKSTNTELKKHIVNTHVKEKIHPCESCGMLFHSIWNLKRHNRIVHRGVKNYKCSYCDQAFAKAETKKNHEMTHTGEKPYKCNFCQKSFIQSIALKKHKEIHHKTLISDTK